MMVLSLSASISAGSSTTEPRAMLIRMPSGPSALSTSALMRFLRRRPARRDGDQDVHVARHVDELRIVAVADARRRPARVIDHRHLHGVEPARDRLADGAHADHADGAVAQRRLGERIGALDPFAGAQIALGLREFAHRAQDQPERGVGDLLVEHLRRVGDGDAVLGRPFDVDVVVADARRSRRSRASAASTSGPRRSCPTTRSTAMARTRGPISSSSASRSLASASRCTVNGASPLTMVGFGGPDSRTSIFPSAMVAVDAPRRNELHQRRHRLLDKSPERRQQLGAERAVDHAVVAGQRHRHHAGEADASRRPSRPPAAATRRPRGWSRAAD